MREAEPLRLPVHCDALVGALAWDPAGERLAVFGRQGLVVVHVRDSKALVLGEPRESVRSMAWSPDGSALAVAYDRDLQRLLRTADGAEIWRASIGQAAVDPVTWSPDGRQIAFVDDEVVVCDAGSGATLWRRGEKRARRVAGVDALFDVNRVRVVERARFEEDPIEPGEVRWSPDARLLAVSWEGMFRVLGARDGEVKAEGTGAGGALFWTSWGEALFEEGESRLARCASHIVDPWARTVTFSRDGRFVAAEGKDHRLWVQDENGVRALDGHPRTIEAMAWSVNGELATACRDGVVRRLPRADGDLEPWAHFDELRRGLAWSPDGTRLAVCCADAVFVLSATA